MRQILCTSIVMSALALVATGASAQEAKPAKAPTAVSAERFATNASYTPPAQGHGYSAEARHKADCLASFQTYDPRTDRVRVSSGASRRCTL